MATSCRSSSSLLHTKLSKSFQPLRSHRFHYHSTTPKRINRGSFLGIQKNRGSNIKELVVKAIPDPESRNFLSFLPLDNQWIAGIAGFMATIPFLVQRLLTITREVDVAAETVEKIADSVEEVAEEVEKAAENLEESLPEGGLKDVVNSVEGLAEETAKDAQKVEDLMDKVEELDEKVETYFSNQSKD